MTTKVVYEVAVRRENGDRDMLYLCLACLGTTGDFLKVIRKKKCPATMTCDRCE